MTCKYISSMFFLIFTVLTFFSLCVESFSEDNEYHIGPGDVIQIYVYQYEQFNTTVPVGPDGKITIPLLGDIVADGRTKSELRRDISEKLSKYIKEGADVTVSITQFNSKKISVFGRVTNPRTMTFSSIPSLLEVIVQAVPTSDADLTAVKIIPSDKTARDLIIVNLSNVLQTGDTSKLPSLHSGDIIYVPKIEIPKTEEPRRESTTPTTMVQQTVGEKIEEQKFIINVMGAVTNPGSFTFTEEPTLAQVLIRAGSVTDSSALKDVRIIRNAPTDSDRIIYVDMSKYLINGDSSIMPRLYSGDVVYVPPLTHDKMRELSLIITGEVVKPGTYPLSEPLDILAAIYIAGGLTPNADPERIRIRKEDAESYQDKIVDISEPLRSAEKYGQTEMVGPGYIIYVPMKQRNPATVTAIASRGIVAFLADIIPIYGLYRIIRD
ncbi:MAG: polysaccharide biosynthesis/export family protein [bacterium]